MSNAPVTFNSPAPCSNILLFGCLIADSTRACFKAAGEARRKFLVLCVPGDLACAPDSNCLSMPSKAGEFALVVKIPLSKEVNAVEKVTFEEAE
jgi:hypothetical protein